MTVLFEIILATFFSTVVSILIAGYFSFKLVDRYMNKMFCISAGLLLTVAFTHLVPEAFESHEISQSVGWTFLISVLALFALERLLHTEDASGKTGRGGQAILFGDAFHNFTDGLLIASAFMANNTLGWLTALAIMAHEIPQELGDFFILLHSGYTKARAIVYNMISGLTSIIGGILGFFVLDRIEWLMPYAFAVAASSFIYIALSDLFPELSKKSRQYFWVQLLFILIGVGLAVLATGGLEGGHHH